MEVLEILVSISVGFTLGVEVSGSEVVVVGSVEVSTVSDVNGGLTVVADGEIKVSGVKVAISSFAQNTL